MDMQEMLDTKRNVAGLFDAREREVIRVALARRLATLERMAGNLAKEYVRSPDLREQLVVIRGAESEEEEEQAAGWYDMGVLAAFKEITSEELRLEAQRRQGDLFGANDGEESAKVADAERLPDDDADAATAEWVPWSCSVCGEVRNYPRRDLSDNSATLCPKDCGPTMRPAGAGAPGPDGAPEKAETPEVEAGADDFVVADYEVVDEDPIRSQRLEERPEFSSRRLINALQEAGIYRVGELLDRVRRGSGSLAQIKGLGQKGRREALAVFDAVALSPNGSAPAPRPATKTQQAVPTPEINAALQDCIPAVLSAESTEEEVASMLRQVWRHWVEETPGVSIELIPGDHVHRTEGGRHVLCYVYVSEPDLEPRWWYDYDPSDPDGFDPEDTDRWPPTLRGAQLVAAVRALLGAGETAVATA